MTRLMILASLLLASTAASANQLRVHEFNVRAIERPHAVISAEHRPLSPATDSLRTETNALSSLKLYPVAGTLGRDFFIPYFVDLDRSPISERDFLCRDYTFDGHTGHDPYIRSFREQDIGVPVFAPLDGTVLSVHDGEPDRNTDDNPNAVSNSIVISHVAGYRTEFMHLKRGSITVAQGDTVRAGQQIALIGSSGQSAAPHLHWEVRVNNEPYEPFAGPCRPGGALFERQPEVSQAAQAIGVAFSHSPFSNFDAAPFDNAPRQSVYVQHSQTVYFRAEVANVRAGDTYTLSLTKPSGAPGGTVTDVLTAYTAYLASANWAINTNLDEVGTWILTLRVNGSRVAEVPFTVVSSAAQIANRPPATPRVVFDAVGLRAGDVPVCRAETGLLADPDTDVVTYNYTWSVDGQTVRTVSSAASSDALASNYVTQGRSISCQVTLSDGTLTTQPVSAHATVQVLSRRRAAGRGN